jgi:hypothetical protein
LRNRPNRLRSQEGKRTHGARLPDGLSRNAYDHSPRRDILGDDGIGADDRAFADGDAGQNGRAAPDPGVFADADGFGLVACIAGGLACQHAVVGIADAGVFADHDAFLQDYRGVGDDMHPPRQHRAVTDFDLACALRFQVKPRVQLKRLAYLYHTATVQRREA